MKLKELKDQCVCIDVVRKFMGSQAIRKFNRFELKYLVSLGVAEALKKEILKYAHRDNFNNTNGKYRLVSLYYDSPSYRYYWEKIDGLRFRKKLRIRWYESEKLEDDSVVYVEIKQRVDRVTQKRRVPVTYKEALRLCGEGIMPDGFEKRDQGTLEEIYEMVKLNNLQPKMIISYDREAFIGSKYDLGFRLTFDRFVGFRCRDFDLGLGTNDGLIIPPHFAIMEIKTNERAPCWIIELVSKYQLQLIRISKYCQGVESARLAV